MKVGVKIQSEDRPGFLRSGGTWLAANLVVTTMLTGTLFVPSLAYGTSLVLIVAGTLLGGIVLILVGNIGTRTRRGTMELTEVPFGRAGSVVPKVANILVLMGWSWVQAMLAGVTVNTLVSNATGWSNPVLFSVACELLVVILAVFGHSGISRVEPWLALVILVCMAWIFWQCLGEGQASHYLARLPAEGAYTPSLAFDAVFATAISWTVLSADLNRYGRSQRGTMSGTFLGYTASTILAMAMGATATMAILDQGGPVAEFNPQPLVNSFGWPIAAIVFLSVMATNTMVVYGMVTSVSSLFPAAGKRYGRTVAVVGGISILGATQIALLSYFTDFLLVIGAFFVPVFAIMICDYYLKNKAHYAEGAAMPAFGLPALLSWTVGALTSWWFAYVVSIPCGATLTAFVVTFAVYAVVARRPRRGL